MTNLREKLLSSGLALKHSGKVRETYYLPDHSDKLLVIATDRVSIFDFVLRDTIPKKGEVLTAMTVFWLLELSSDIKHHMVGYGSKIDAFLPEPLRGDKEIQACGLVIENLEMWPIECVVRGYLTGSGWKHYRETSSLNACSTELPPSLHDGSRITASFNPTTKEATGHDMPLDDRVAVDMYGQWVRDLSVDIYRKIATFAEDRGIILADTKFEFGFKPGQDQVPILADEVGTPDSSRFWDLKEWEKSCENKKSPSSYDKQIVRNWGKTVGIDKHDPNLIADVNEVLQTAVPSQIIRKTMNRYLVIFERITGWSLADFQKVHMKIS